jgi:hypothetical protein
MLCPFNFLNKEVLRPVAILSLNFFITIILQLLGAPPSDVGILSLFSAFSYHCFNIAPSQKEVFNEVPC